MLWFKCMARCAGSLSRSASNTELNHWFGVVSLAPAHSIYLSLVVPYRPMMCLLAGSLALSLLGEQLVSCVSTCIKSSTRQRRVSHFYVLLSKKVSLWRYLGIINLRSTGSSSFTNVTLVGLRGCACRLEEAALALYAVIHSRN